MWLRAKKLVTGKLWSPGLSRRELELAEGATVRDDLGPLRVLGERRVARTLREGEAPAEPRPRVPLEPTHAAQQELRPPVPQSPLFIPEFTFLGETRQFTWPIDWRCQSVDPVSHLWRFQLHYQDALWPLASSSSPLPVSKDEGGEGLGVWVRDSQFDLLWKHLLDWATAHPAPTRASLQDAWHPFCISRRVANWMQWWALSSPHPGPLPDSNSSRGATLLRGVGEDNATATLLTSLARQVAFLSDHLEWDLRGNHLLFNLWTIGLAAAFFEGELSEKCLALIDAHLPDQIEEQLTDEGEHFERATAYHIEVSELFLDLREALKPFRPRLAAQCGAIAARMTDLLVGISHPDGTPPLFGDSTFHVQPIFDGLKRTLVNSLDPPSARRPGAQMIGDYWVWRHDDDCLIFDTGPVGADELPAHAHCDLLGFEASIGGQKLFVDSGVSNYDDDELRAYCRSTAAHNCLEIDGLSQCDVWGKFRMGYRGHSEILEEGQQGSDWWCQASHDAYRRIGVPLVARLFKCNDEGVWLCQDVLWGSGEHELVSRLHLHPDVQVLELTSPQVILQVASQRVQIVFEGAEGVLSTTPGRYCPEFGQEIPTTVLEFRRKTKVPAVIQWKLEKIP